MSADAGYAFRSPAAAEILCAFHIGRARIALKPAERQACSGPRGARCERRGGRLLPAASSAGAVGLRYFTDARHVCSHLEQLRKRYAEDEEFRQKRIAYAIAYQKAHAKEISERRRRRRKADPAYRQKLIAVAHAYYEANKEELTERLRRRRRDDPEYRDKLQARERKAKNPMTQRKHRLRCIYGISLEEYDTMLARQGGACAICKKKPDTGKSLCVDHCHVTGMVRGLLCHKCNSVLAFGNDDLDILRAAIAYLQAALASEASGQRGNFNSARAGPSP